MSKAAAISRQDNLVMDDFDFMRVSVPGGMSRQVFSRRATRLRPIADENRLNSPNDRSGNQKTEKTYKKDCMNFSDSLIKTISPSYSFYTGKKNAVESKVCEDSNDSNSSFRTCLTDKSHVKETTKSETEILQCVRFALSNSNIYTMSGSEFHSALSLQSNNTNRSSGKFFFFIPHLTYPITLSLNKIVML